MQLLTIFMVRNWFVHVCANFKLKEAKTPIEIGVYMYYLQMYSNLRGMPLIAQPGTSRLAGRILG